MAKQLELLDFAQFCTWIFLSTFYLLLPSLFLYILTWTLSELFAEICKETELAFATGQDVDRMVQVSGVRHSLVCQAVWTLKEFFSSIMLVNVAYIFISSITYCFAVLYRIDKSNFAAILPFAISSLIRFLVLDAIGQAAERLREKVHSIGSCMLHVNLCKLSTSKADSIHQFLIRSNLLLTGNTMEQVINLVATIIEIIIKHNLIDKVMKLVVQVHQSRPILTVGGYFEINRQLIPIVSYISLPI